MIRVCFVARKFKCTTYCARLIFFCINIVILCLGIALIINGIGYKMKYDPMIKQLDNLDKNVKYISTLVIIAGTVVSILALIGACGAACGSFCILVSYLVMMLFMFLIQSSILGYLLVLAGSIEDETEYKKFVYYKLLGFLMEYDESAFYRESVDYMQQSFNCCGIGDPCDWLMVTHNIYVPWSCCKKKVENCTQDNSFSRGCLKPLFEKVEEKQETIIQYLAVIGGIELGAFVVVIFLINMIRVDDLIYDYPAKGPVYYSTPLYTRRED